MPNRVRAIPEYSDGPSPMVGRVRLSQKDTIPDQLMRCRVAIFAILSVAITAAALHCGGDARGASVNTFPVFDTAEK